MNTNDGFDEQEVYSFRGGELVRTKRGNMPESDKDLKAAGFSHIETFSSNKGLEHEVYRLRQSFVIHMQVCADEYEVVYVDSLPDYLSFLKECLQPLLNVQTHSTLS